MSRITRVRFLLVVASFLVLAMPSIAAERFKGNLVGVDWLQKHLDNPDVLVLDASAAQIYAAQHIPGAVSVDVFSYGAQEISGAEMEQRIQSWGVSPGKTVVVYDQGGTFMATRLFFTLYYHGFPAENLAILDGGLSKWQAEGLTVSKDPVTATKGSFKVGKLNEDVRVRLPEFLTASGDPVNNVLVEALGADWHFGQVAPLGRPGHIPNGVLLPAADFFNADKTFKSPQELRRMLAYLEIEPEQQIYTYCGGGIAASVPFFALKYMLGYPRVELFIESELGWLKDERELPFWTYDAPGLMRDIGWLQAWGGKMMRMYGVSHLSVVDVRPADAFNEGHLPFALNVPADVFKSNLASPEKLAGILAAAGVDPSQEAVVISGAGVSRDSALAFVMLEKLGQKKASVLIDSREKWTSPAFAVTKDATAVDPKRGPASYQANIREGVIIADPKSTQGVYPKVFIASGASVPARAQDGTVVHVPYTELLNADGTPKAAKDIWTILAKAGVPRYAELVCFSDDPGEAAANYFVLKLMGFPDIKVLVM